jgi:hypothetical protein
MAAARPLPMPSAREPAPVTMATFPFNPMSGMFHISIKCSLADARAS